MNATHRRIPQRVLTIAVALAALLHPSVASSPHHAPPVQADDASRAGVDGPYVWRVEDGSFTLKRIVAGDAAPKLESATLPAEEAHFELTLPGESKPLKVRLRGSATPPPASVAAPERLFVVSDIEGELDALLKLLRAGGVVDEQLRWTFGTGHVAYLGDLFDRGLHVTECLWLFYELEARANEHGGALHFVLGNHEVMNLTGDLRYVRRKYHENAALLSAPLSELYSRDTVLGQWLRTRNAAVRIGDELFVHGGVSPTVARAKLSIEQLNSALQAALAADTWPKPKDGPLALAAGGSDSLIWYRGYLKAPIVKEAELDGVLAHLGVRRIVVGHTVVDDIGFVLGGRVLAVDVHHAGGNSQAALREKGVWHRLQASGERKKL